MQFKWPAGGLHSSPHLPRQEYKKHQMAVAAQSGLESLTIGFDTDVATFTWCISTLTFFEHSDYTNMLPILQMDTDYQKALDFLKDLPSNWHSNQEMKIIAQQYGQTES